MTSHEGILTRNAKNQGIPRTGIRVAIDRKVIAVCLEKNSLQEYLFPTFVYLDDDSVEVRSVCVSCTRMLSDLTLIV